MEAALRQLGAGRQISILAGIGLTVLQAGPVVAGLVFVLLPSFGHLPALGKVGFTLAPWSEALSEPGLWQSVAATLISGVPASLISLCLAIAIAGRLAPDGNIAMTGAGSLRGAMQLIVAVPPVALAIGFAFVLAPSGWIARLAASIFEWQRPPEWPMQRDPFGLSLGLALILKETPFLTLACLAALHQMKPRRPLLSAIGLGYDPACAWVKVVLPELLIRLRWPFFAVLAYALSAVELATLLGPTTPPTLAVVITDMGRDPDLARRLPAACLAILQVVLVAAVWFCCWASAWLGAQVFRPWLVGGGRELAPMLQRMGRWTTRLAVILGALILAMSLFSLPIWSLANTWRYPEVLPDCCSVSGWHRAIGQSMAPLLWSLGLAAGSSVAALLATIVYLSVETDLGRGARNWTWSAIFMPLVAPDIAFLLGAQVLFLSLGWRAGWVPVFWAHFLYVFPYVLLILADSWRCLDPRYEQIAACLGAGPWRRLFMVRLALLCPTLLFAGALGIAVSLSLYLPTVLLSGGRLATLATEAVALGSGGDRRVLGVHGSLQMLLAWVFFALAAIAGQRRFQLTDD